MEDKEIQTERDPSAESSLTTSLLILDLEQKLTNLTHFMHQSTLEHRQNYAAINAQLHLINERLRSSDPIIASRGNVSNINLQRELLRCISRDKSKATDELEKNDLSGSETLHRECLMENLEEMVRDMDLNSTHLMDELLDNECLTQDEASDISHISTRKDQIRKLIVLFAKRGRGNFVKFLEVIGRKHQYPHIAKELRRIYDLKTSEGRSSECLLCVIKRDVDIRDVVDHLCRHQIIDIEFLDLVISGQSGNQNSLWEIVFSNVDKSSNRKQKIQYLQEALSKKYDKLASKLGFLVPAQLGNHICSKPITNFSQSWRSTGSMSSIGDRSTTSEPPRKSDSGKPGKISSYEQLQVEISTNIPKCIDWLNTHTSPTASSDDDTKLLSVTPESTDSGIESTVNGNSLHTEPEAQKVTINNMEESPDHRLSHETMAISITSISTVSEETDRLDQTNKDF
ncbi:uncharacterized protein LOC133184687 [Saccostrea echinata]|uniref:uncharacterized protein LOC133184687 n=1 Tax=Saccostrea echinata TaxID=191078 RepID=UPI002A83388F|nr:uncharacterized protein LOC133184687 [Saccostrea echinata]